MSTLQHISEVWNILKVSFESGDSSDAAEALVGYLVDEGFSPNDIKQSFRGDTEIKKSLDFFLETPDSGLYHQPEDDLFDDYDEDDLFDDYDE